MPDPRFEALRLRLARGGVAPAYVERTIVELTEHYLDLESAALAAGETAQAAADLARAALGDERAIAAAILSRPELLAWSARHPRFAYCCELPGRPLMFCIAHRPEIARWGVALGIAVTLVGGILAALNWLIVLG
jgi:hypothetical protein